MPPKKKTVASEGSEAEGGAFRWTLENEKKLLILTQGRYLTGEDYERIVTVFPGTNKKGVQVRVSLLRVEQRKLFEEYGWTLPEGAAKAKGPVTPRKNTTPKATTPKKRAALGADGDGEGDDSEDGTPKAKKARGRKPKVEVKEKSVEKESVEEDGEEDVELEEDYIPMAKRVKEEPVEEMV
ncbi:hypothetical protein AA0117_g3849 [Alternaria alternata]|uniref:Myb-like domain-containing protein n=1 Tax=Alternaria alternata TaxID=5599 RepID=A0A4Q4NKY2_ALTAL|nr:hypothetical protein AA0117_g3849 [Alternaria alternata]